MPSQSQGPHYELNCLLQQPTCITYCNFETVERPDTEHSADLCGPPRYKMFKRFLPCWHHLPVYTHYCTGSGCSCGVETARLCLWGQLYNALLFISSHSTYFQPELTRVPCLWVHECSFAELLCSLQQSRAEQSTDRGTLPGLVISCRLSLALLFLQGFIKQAFPINRNPQRAPPLFYLIPYLLELLMCFSRDHV